MTLRLLTSVCESEVSGRTRGEQARVDGVEGRGWTRREELGVNAMIAAIERDMARDGELEGTEEGRMETPTRAGADGTDFGGSSLLQKRFGEGGSWMLRWMPESRQYRRQLVSRRGACGGLAFRVGKPRGFRDPSPRVVIQNKCEA